MANRRARKAKGSGRLNVLRKLEDRVSDGDYYGALQMYKTLYSRHLNDKEFQQAIESAESWAFLESELDNFKRICQELEKGMKKYK